MIKVSIEDYPYNNGIGEAMLDNKIAQALEAEGNKLQWRDGEVRPKIRTYGKTLARYVISKSSDVSIADPLQGKARRNIAAPRPTLSLSLLDFTKKALLKRNPEVLKQI